MVDRYAVSVVKDRTVVGHLPRKISRVCSLFLRCGVITCEITGRKCYSKDLVQGGLEVPCILILKSDNKQELEKSKKIIKCEGKLLYL